MLRVRPNAQNVTATMRLMAMDALEFARLTIVENAKLTICLNVKIVHHNINLHHPKVVNRSVQSNNVYSVNLEIIQSAKNAKKDM